LDREKAPVKWHQAKMIKGTRSYFWLNAGQGGRARKVMNEGELVEKRRAARGGDRNAA
jgi:hypothetical protein